MANSAAQEAVTRFADSHDEFVLAAKTLEDSLNQILREAGAHGVVSARAKDVRSFGQKIFRKQYTDPWRQITDKVGGRIVVAMPDDVDAIVESLAAAMTGAAIEDKRGVEDPASLEYSGVHVTGVLAEVLVSGESITVEVQVRTIVQDAWSVVSHSLVYKPVVTLPVAAQHRIMRLVALAEIFDEEVARVVELTRDEPGFDLVPLARLSEDLAVGAGIFDGDRTTSLFILNGIRGALPDDLVEYRQTLEDFVTAQRERIHHLVGQHGPGSESSGLWENLLVGQPESLVILERLSAAPHLFQEKWVEAGLPEASLIPFKNLLGVSDDRGAGG